MFNIQETDACRRLVKLAIEEDLGADGDLTSRALIPPEQIGNAVFVARGPGILAGVAAASLVFEAVDPRVIFRPVLRDRAEIVAGSHIASVSGSLRSILSAERTALNFMQHLSGIATLTSRYVQAIAGLPCQILDTRKTTPGWRLLEKYGVRCGGGHNHRMGLYDALLIKDNHIAAVRSRCDADFTVVKATIELANASVPWMIEVEDLDRLDSALSCGPQVILLDNMSVDSLREAVARRNQKNPKVLLEASGKINLANVRTIAETGVDRISIGALTHSAPALDIALDYVEK
jgi:nicotinate-nucleotide pyrophosphorylase (carboxylating)